MSWSDIDIRIPTVPERCDLMQDLVDDVERQTGQSPTVSPQSPGRPPSDRVPRIFGPRTDSSWILHLEDDVRLGPDFGRVIPSVLQASDRPAVSFFDTVDGATGLHTARKPFYWAQCLAVRADIAPGFVPFYEEWIASHDEHHSAVDVAFGDYTTHIGTPIYVYRPSQVQHRPVPSTLGSRSTHRQSPTFDDGGGDE